MLDTLPLPQGQQSTPRKTCGASAVLPIEAEGVTFAAGGCRLVDGIDLAVEPGPLTAIIGPNGAGKSLLLRLLHGLLAPTAGRVRWAGKPPGRALRRRQAMVFQRPVLLRRSAAANVRHALRARGFGGEPLEDRTAASLAAADLRALAGRPARLLSGGEQQRLAVARALAATPDVLFLDEPTASLDPASVLAIERLIRRAYEAGTKIVLVTHDLGQARRLADEVVFLYRGRLEERAPAGRFFSRPASEKARAFIEGRIVL